MATTTVTTLANAIATNAIDRLVLDYARQASSAPIPRITWPYAMGTDQFYVAAGASPGAATDTWSLVLPVAGTVVGGVTASYDNPEGLLATLNALAQTTVATGSGPLVGLPLSEPGGSTHQNTFVFALTPDGFVTITASNFPSPDTFVTIDWLVSTPGTQELGTRLGFITATDLSDYLFSGNATTSVTFTAPMQITNFWTPDLPVRSDSRDTSTFARGLVAIPGATAGMSSVYGLDLAQQYRRELQFENVPDSRTFLANESVPNTALERLWQPTTGGYTGFQYAPDRTVPATFNTYALEEQASQEFKPERQYDTVPLYKFGLKMLRIG